MRGTSVSLGQVAMIAYLYVTRRERFFTYMMFGAIKFLPSMSHKMGTLAESIDSTLCSKFFLSEPCDAIVIDTYTTSCRMSNGHNMPS